MSAPAPRARLGLWLLLSVVVAGCAGASVNPTPVAVPRSAIREGGVEVAGYLARPRGDGPFPAAVLLHGCAGLQLATTQRPTFTLLSSYAAWYNARGYVTLILDSFGPRGVDQVCADGSQPPGPAARALDAYQGLAYLAGLPHVDASRVVLQGHSHGGWTVLRALDEQFALYAEYMLGRRHRFAAGIAYYPYCPGALGRELYPPLLILIGAKDDWTPAQPCVDLHAYQVSRGRKDVRLALYPEAYHSYDSPYPGRYNAQGKWLAFDASAARDSERQVDRFLKEFVR